MAGSILGSSPSTWPGHDGEGRAPPTHVESQQPTLAMRDHCGDDVRIVDLAACKLVMTAQFGELCPYRWAVLQHAESMGEGSRIGYGMVLQAGSGFASCHVAGAREQGGATRSRLAMATPGW